jgi:LysR family transcriptional regulator (chromosome initiation inhibitor)
MKELAPSSSGGTREDERVAIAINADSIATWALDALGELVREGLPLEIITDDQDFTQEWLRGGQVLGCVTTLKAALRGCKVVPLGAMNYIAVCANSLADTKGFDAKKGLAAHHFKNIPFIAFNRKDDMQTEFVAKAFGLKRVGLQQLFVPSSLAQLRAVKDGWGVSVLPQMLVQPAVDAGELLHLLPDFSLPVQLYWHCWNLESEVLDQLTHAIQSSAKKLLK